jgi:Acetyltransferase (GNAT) family
MEDDTQDCEVLGYISKEYQIRDSPIGFELWHEEIRVGHLYFHLWADYVEFSDLLIRDDIKLQSNTFWGRLWGKPRKINYRKRGLGSALLRYFIEHVKSKGARRIEGRIVPLDSEPQPKLEGWYRSHGFTVVHPPDDSKTNATISMELNPKGT